MTAANHIGYFTHLVEQGKITEDEASKKLKELHEIDMKHDEFDRQMVAMLHFGSVLTKEQTDKLFTLAEKPIKIEF